MHNFRWKNGKGLRKVEAVNMLCRPVLIRINKEEQCLWEK